MITLIEGANELNVQLTPIAVPTISIVGVTWEGNIGAAPGSLVKATVVVSNLAAEFTDRLSLTLGSYQDDTFTPSPQGGISGQRFMTEEEWLDELQWFTDYIAYLISIGATNSARVLSAQKAKVAQYYQLDGFVYMGYLARPDPNVFFETELATNAGSKMYKKAQWHKQTIDQFPYPVGEYGVKTAFSIWDSAMGGDFDVLVQLEGVGVSYVSLAAISIVPP